MVEFDFRFMGQKWYRKWYKLKLYFNTIQYYQCFKAAVRLLAAAYPLKILFFMRLKWSKYHDFLGGEWWSKIRFAGQYTRERIAKGVFRITIKSKNDR